MKRFSISDFKFHILIYAFNILTSTLLYGQDYYPNVSTKGSVSDGEIAVFDGVSGRYVRSCGYTNADQYIQNLKITLGALQTNVNTASNALNLAVGQVQTNLNTHTAATGTNAHGLGTAAIRADSYFDLAGTAAGVQTNLTAASNALTLAIGAIQTNQNMGSNALNLAGQVQTNLNTHTAATGTNAHGLGTAATRADSYFDLAGAAAGVQTNLTAASNALTLAIGAIQTNQNMGSNALNLAGQVQTNLNTHTAATGTNAHGLGTAALRGEGDFATAAQGAKADLAITKSGTNQIENMMIFEAASTGINISPLTGVYTGIAVGAISWTGGVSCVQARTYLIGFEKQNNYGTGILTLAGASLTATNTGMASNYVLATTADTNLILTLWGNGTSKSDVSNVFVYAVTNGRISVAGDIYGGRNLIINGTNIAEHAGATGTNAHGLGTAATRADSYFDLAGAAAGVQTNLNTASNVLNLAVGQAQTNLNTHTAATGTNAHGLGTAATRADSYFDLAGAAAGVQTNLNTHTAATGTNVHGLGTAATRADSYFDLAGTAAGVQTNLNTASNVLNLAVGQAQTNLNTHTAATGTNAHGLGTAATREDSYFDLAGAAAGVQTNLNTASNVLNLAVGQAQTNLNTASNALNTAIGNITALKTGNTTTTAGKCYQWVTNSWVAANCTNETLCNRMLGIAIGTNSTSAGIQTLGPMTVTNNTLSPGAGIFVSATAGEWTQTAPTNSGYILRLIGFATATNEIFVKPDGVWGAVQ